MVSVIYDKLILKKSFENNFLPEESNHNVSIVVGMYNQRPSSASLQQPDIPQWAQINNYTGKCRPIK